MIFSEVPLPDEMVAELDKVLVRLNNYDRSLMESPELWMESYDETITKEHAQRRVSPAALDQILMGHDRNVATADENMFRLPPEFIKGTPLPGMFEDFVKRICEVGDRKSIFHVTGKFWYPDNGFMGWHTNNAYPGFRFYCTHAQEADKSFFRYREPDTGKIVTSWDRAGWMGRIFKIDKDKPLWHCVYSETNRISTGCNLEVETNYSVDWEKLGGRA